MFWSGFVSRAGASHRVNLDEPFPLGQNCPGKIAMTMTGLPFNTLRTLKHSGRARAFSERSGPDPDEVKILSLIVHIRSNSIPVHLNIHGESNGGN